MERAIAYATTRRRKVLLGSVALTLLLGACTHSHSHVATGTPPTSLLLETTTTTTLATYTVRSGDTLIGIAQQHHVSVNAIVTQNRLTDPNHIAAGKALLIPPRPPLHLVVTPTRGHAGDAFEFHLSGALPGETITFEVTSPAGKFTGSPHKSSEGGDVNATYQTSFNDPDAGYKVTATGDEGTVIRAGFRVFSTLS